MKIKKYIDPTVTALEITKTITKIGAAASNHAKVSLELREALADGLAKLTKHFGKAVASAIIDSVTSVRYVCGRCGRDAPETQMSGERCMDCAMAERAIADSESAANIHRFQS